MGRYEKGIPVFLFRYLPNGIIKILETGEKCYPV
jgi:hypothetical protein